jgi:hypothetical protein
LAINYKYQYKKRILTTDYVFLQRRDADDSKNNYLMAGSRVEN